MQGGIVLLRRFEDYCNGYEDAKEKHHPGYIELIDKLETEFPLGTAIVGEQAEKDFIRLFGAILSLRNIFSAFDKLEEIQPLTFRDLQDYQSIYVDLYDKYCTDPNRNKENINDIIVFEIELIK